MAIRVVCENEKEFDPSIGSLTYCDAAFSCPDHMLGKIVKCPGCHQPIRIGSSKLHVSSETGRPVSYNRNVVRKPSSENLQSVNGSISQRSSNSAVKTRPADEKVTKVDQQKSSAKSKKQKSRPSDSATTFTEATTSICPDCGMALTGQSLACPACHKVVKRPKGIGKKRFEIQKPVGLHYWLIHHAFSGVPQAWVKRIIHALFGLTMVAVIMSAFLLFPPYTAMAITTGILIFPPLYLYLWYRCHVVCHNLAVPLNWWQRLFWNSVLTFARSRGWPHESDSTALNKRVILDFRSKPVDDNGLQKLESIQHAAIIDLSGSSLSDDGCKVLHHLSNLQCLVLSDTKVTRAEVARIQLSLPRCWIWH